MITGYGLQGDVHSKVTGPLFTEFRESFIEWGVTTKPENPPETPSSERAQGDVPLHGLEEASKLSRSGRFISAIKYLEAANLEISREQAKAIVNSFGYINHEWRPPEKDHRPIRCL